MQQGVSLRHVIEQVSQEKGIDTRVLVEATEQAILTAAKRTFGVNRELEARFNEETGQVDLFQYMTVVDEVENEEREVSTEAAKRHGLEPLAVVRAGASAGVDPAIMGTGPIPATRRCLEKAGWQVPELDLVEANEAFAAQAISVNRELGWDPAKVNVNGGAIALGHPIGASGARILVTLLHAMATRGRHALHRPGAGLRGGSAP